MKGSNINNIVYSTQYEGAMAVINAPANCVETRKLDGSIERIPTACRNEVDEGITAYSHGHAFVGQILDAQRTAEMVQVPHDVLIDSQTGSGKSHFVFDCLYPQIHMRKQHLLYFASRKALKDKGKYDALKAAAPEVIDDYTPKGLAKQHHFNDIDVYSYQDLFGDSVGSKNRQDILADLKAGVYGAVVFDEIHYAVADADFSWSTQATFNWLLDTTIQYRVPRFYLSATMQDIYDKIVDGVYSRTTKKMLADPSWNYPAPGFMHIEFHYFQRDYSYFDVHFFSDNEDLVTRINSSEDQKWLILVDTKSLAASLQSKITRESFFLDSEELHQPNKDGTSQAIINGLTQEGSLKTDVLLATKCLDVGVDVLDRDVNVVCYLTSQTDFIQAIGRKRPQSKERVNLWIPLYTAKDVRSWVQRTTCKYTEFSEAMHCHPKGEVAYGTTFPMPLYLDNGRYAHNEFAVYKLSRFLCEWQSVLEAVESMTEPEQQVYIARHFLGWLGLTESFSNLPQLFGEHGQRQKDLLDVIEPWMGESMDKDEFDVFSQALIDAGFEARKDTRETRGPMGLNKVNEVLKEVGLMVVNEKGLYKIQSKGKDDQQ